MAALKLQWKLDQETEPELDKQVQELDGLAAKVTKMSPHDAAKDEPIPIVGISRICELDAARQSKIQPVT